MKIEDGVIFLDIDEAKATLANSEYIHVFSNPSGMLVGADWTSKELHKAIETAETLRVGGSQCRAMGHGLVVFTKDEEEFFVEADTSKYNEKDDELVKEKDQQCQA